MESKRGEISRSSNWTRMNKDRGREDKRSIRLADLKESQEHIEAFGTH